jgi:Bacterial Ig domain
MMQRPLEAGVEDVMRYRAWVQVLGLALLAGCGNGLRMGEGHVTVLGPATGDAVVCGGGGGQGSGATMLLGGSGFQSEHGVEITVIFTATSGTPFEGGTSATEQVAGVVLADDLVESQVPSFSGSVEATITVILPGENRGTSGPVTLTTGGYLGGPYAFYDFYSVLSTDVLTVPAAQGALANDFPYGCYEEDEVPRPLGALGGLTVVAYDPVGAPGGGTMVMQPDGSFVYTPPVSFLGTDVFNYTVESNGMQVMAQVHITVN